MFVSYLFVLLLVIIHYVSGQQVLLEIVTDIDGCVGGEICIQQPSINVVDRFGSILTNFSGVVAVQIGHSPTYNSTLWLGTCNYTSCGIAVKDRIGAADIINGAANFQDLQIDKAGIGYKLKFFGLYIDGTGFYTITSNPFTVTVGPVYNIKFTQYITTALGGVPLTPNPAVGAVDRGGNIVTNINGYFVTVALYDPPDGVSLLPLTATTTTFYQGRAEFSSLYIKKAGEKYVLVYNASLAVYTPLLYSDPFRVGIGSPARIIFDSTTLVTLNPIYGGEFFTMTPRLYILDAGDNIVSSDSISGIKVTISDNPSNGTLLPLPSTFIARRGIISVSGLNIDKAGRGYKLNFNLLQYSRAHGILESSSINLLTDAFTVLPGPVRKLYNKIYAYDAIAGGSPFSVQPKLELHDYGDNVIISDSTSIVTCHMIPSLATSARILIDAIHYNTIPNTIESVTINLESGIYGSGQLIVIDVIFRYEVYLTNIYTNNNYPTLLLTLYNSSGMNIEATLVSIPNYDTLMQFQYRIQEGDYTLTTLDYQGVNAIQIHGGNIETLNTSVILDMPSSSNNISSSKTIIIDTTPPRVINITTFTSNGEYGAGEVIQFALQFNYDIVVTGIPYLVLNTHNDQIITEIVPFNISNSNYSNSTNVTLLLELLNSTTTVYHNYTTPTAAFDSYYTSNTLLFSHTVRQGDYGYNLTFDNIIYIPLDATILRSSDLPTTSVNITIDSTVMTAFNDITIININTDPPYIDTTYGIRTNHSNGMYYPGEDIYLTIKYTKPISIYGIFGSITLQLSTGMYIQNKQIGYAAYQSVLPDEQTILFKYSVEKNTNKTSLDILPTGSALSVPAFPSSYIRRKSTYPTTDVNTNTTDLYYSGNSLRNTANIDIYGSIPFVTVVQVNNTIPSNTLIFYPDDIINIAVVFNTRVVISCRPVVVLNVGYAREASYISGNHTNILYFKYIVNMGDQSTGLRYRYTNGFCLESGCPITTKCTIYADSNNPTQPADPGLPLFGGTLQGGVAFTNNSYIITPTIINRNTTIISITTTNSPGNYGPGTLVYFNVLFSDDVLYASLGQRSSPQLHLNVPDDTNSNIINTNTNAFAQYAGGSGSRILSFSYVVPINITYIPELLPSNYDLISNSAFLCDPLQYCEIRNRNGILADLTTPSTVITPTGLLIDPIPPLITRVWTDKPTSPYDGVYTVGEVINIYLQYDKEVVIITNTPRIYLNTSNVLTTETYAIYEPSYSNSTVLGFTYIVQEGDVTNDIMYYGPDLDLKDGLSKIYRLSTSLSTFANYTLPLQTTLGLNGNIIAFDTYRIPKIINVTSITPSGYYRLWDTIYFQVNYNHPVIFNGYPYILLNVGDHTATARCTQVIPIGTNSSAISYTLPSPVVKTLIFEYTIQENDFNIQLEYIDHYAFFPGLTLDNTLASVYAASTTPTLIANTDLPSPNMTGSLSSSATLYIKGERAYQIDLKYISTPGTYYLNDTVIIQMTFSQPVYVTGRPYIELNVGLNNRRAYYTSGHLTDILYFIYDPQPGDYTNQLDYTVDRRQLNSAIHAFSFNYGTILTYSSVPSLPAIIYLNPIDGVLEGTTAITASNGLVPFIDLIIPQQGPNYLLRFTNTNMDINNTLTLTQIVYVSFTNEYELRPSQAKVGDLVGYSVAISNDISVLGSPGANLSVSSIQNLTTNGAFVAPLRHIQMISTSIQSQVAIQQFNTYCLNQSVIQGSFQVTCGEYGPTRPIPVDANADMIQAIFEYDLNILGRTVVTRVPYANSTCQQAYQWTITFLDRDLGYLSDLSFNTTGLIGSGATIQGPNILQRPAVLSGGFYLSLNHIQSSFIPYDANKVTMIQALESLDLSVFDIAITPSNEGLARSWIITFNVFELFNDIPLLDTNYTHTLLGGRTIVNTEILRHGIHSTFGLAGYFQLEFRNSTTDLLAYNATAEEVQTALLALPTIVTVNVTRTGPSFIQGYSWIIEISQVNIYTKYGYIPDAMSVIEPLTPINKLIGSDTSITVDMIQSSTYGPSAGVAYVYQNQLNKFVQVAALRGDDTQQTNQYGYSVAIEGDYIVVGSITTGAPSIHFNETKQGSVYIYRGYYECFSNETFCPKTDWRQIDQVTPSLSNTTEGFGYSVTISYPLIAVGAPLYEQGTGRVYIYTHINNYTYNNITREKWVFFQTVQANDLLLGDHFGHSIALYDSVLVVGAPYAHQNDGRVILFKRIGPGYIFAESQLFYPSMIGGNYGYSLALQSDKLVISAPMETTDNIYLGKTPTPNVIESGRVYLYQRSSPNRNFKFYQYLIPSNVRERDRYGHHVAIDDKVIVISAIQDYTGIYYANKPIIQVETIADYNIKKLSGSFRLFWNFTNTTTSFRSASTRDLPWDVTSADLKEALENDLNTGTILVSRSNMDIRNKGYAWAITFVESTEYVNLFSADWSGLYGVNPYVNITYINPNPPRLRGTTHIFYRGDETHDMYYTEQLYVTPIVYEPSDRCGWQVSVSGLWALVGCPNRDSPAVPNHNTGGGIMYNLNLLTLEFTNTSFSVIEGDSQNVTIQRSQSALLVDDVFFNISTIDRNSPKKVQTFFENIYGLTDVRIPYPSTVIDYVGVGGLAIARSQYYGSIHNESSFIDGQYDYRAISDYVPINSPQAYLTTDISVTDTIITTADRILEKPDETVTIGLHSPGIWPSILGSLYAHLTIVDSGDGLVSLDPIQDGNSVPLLQYDKIYNTMTIEADHTIGESVTVNSDIRLMVTGSPLASVNDHQEAGQVFLYYLFNEQWIEYDILISPNVTTRGRFGHEVVLSEFYKLNMTYLFIGEPGQSQVHIYRSNYTIDSITPPLWVLDTTLICPTGYLPQNLYGTSGTIATNKDILVIGSPLFETVYLYYHIYDEIIDIWQWVLSRSLQSSDYAYDLIYNTIHLHRQRFGSAVAISQRTIAIGAPYADYDPIGVDAVELNWDTEGTDIFTTGRGKVYMYYSTPSVLNIKLISDGKLSNGTFRLQYTHFGFNETTIPLQYNADAIQMKSALESLLNIDQVAVTSFISLIGRNNLYSWTITFLSSWQQADLLLPIWYNYGCQDCIPYNANQTTMTSQWISNIGDFEEQITLSAEDKRVGDRFGSSLALDGNQLMVGAIYSNSIARTTWDFEVGTLEGWSKTGTAFDYQPTYQDNTRFHSTYEGDRNRDLRGKLAHTRLVGNYFIGTYEKRPGNSLYFDDGDINYPQGTVQGDEPIGTLISDVFLILGNKISFLIGGGCDYYLEYVELLIDGISVDKVTGKCRDRMEPAIFDVSKYYNHAAQIRIVDLSHANWGHINVDNFQFDWDIEGARHNNTNIKISTNGKVETPLTGAVYSFVRTASDGLNICKENILTCIWKQDAKLNPSDKRTQYLFGSKIYVNDTHGIAYITAPNSNCNGYYKEFMTVYPYMNAIGEDIAAGLNYPIPMRHMDLFEAYTSLAPQASGAGGILKLMNISNNFPDARISQQCGAIYIYVKDFPLFSASGDVITPQHWNNVESIKLQPSDSYAYDHFGSSMAVHGSLLVVGAPGQDGYTLDKGAIYSFNNAFASLQFASKEFIALEGSDNFALVTVTRNLQVYSGSMVIHYATSDITAIGVDQEKYTACMQLPPLQRGSAYCGDYRQTEGYLVIEQGKEKAGFEVPVINDECNEKYLKFLEITVSVPGSNALQGEKVSAKVRIDDDDFIQDTCAQFD